MEKDEELYYRYLGGDDDALEILIERHSAPLILFIYGITKDITESEDIMIETFARLNASDKIFKGNSTFKTWLFTIGRNLALKYIRKRRFDTTLEDDFQTGEERSPESEYLESERKEEMLSAMEKLEPDYRQSLFLMYFEDMSYEQISKVMSKSIKQVTNLVYRGKKALRKILEESRLKDA